jgi:hypothetical protein
MSIAERCGAPANQHRVNPTALHRGSNPMRPRNRFDALTKPFIVCREDVAKPKFGSDAINLGAAPCKMSIIRTIRIWPKSGVVPNIVESRTLVCGSVFSLKDVGKANSVT